MVLCCRTIVGNRIISKMVFPPGRRIGKVSVKAENVLQADFNNEKEFL